MLYEYGIIWRDYNGEKNFIDNFIKRNYTIVLRGMWPKAYYLISIDLFALILYKT